MNCCALKENPGTRNSHAISTDEFKNTLLIALLDENPQAIELSSYFVSQGHQCDVFCNPEIFRRTFTRTVFDIVVLDGDFTSGDFALDILRWIRKDISSAVPIAFVAASGQKTDIVKALLAGADDFLTKPVRANELLDRLTILVKLNTKTTPDIQDYPPYRFDKAAQLAYFDDYPLNLTSREFEFALFLFTNQNELLTRQRLMASVWGISAKLNTRTVDVHASRVRKKLRLGNSTNWSLISVYQRGYRLENTRNLEVVQASTILESAE